VALHIAKIHTLITLGIGIAPNYLLYRVCGVARASSIPIARSTNLLTVLRSPPPQLYLPGMQR